MQCGNATIHDVLYLCVIYVLNQLLCISTCTVTHGFHVGYYILTGLPIVALTGLPIVALTGLPIGYSVIVALTGLPIGYSVIVALTGLPIGYSVIVAL